MWSKEQPRSSFIRSCSLPGRHVIEDLPRLITDAAEAHEGVAFAMADPLGSHAGVIDAVIERCEAAFPNGEPDEH